MSEKWKHCGIRACEMQEKCVLPGACQSKDKSEDKRLPDDDRYLAIARADRNRPLCMHCVSYEFSGERDLCGALYSLVHDKRLWFPCTTMRAEHQPCGHDGRLFRSINEPQRD